MGDGRLQSRPTHPRIDGYHGLIDSRLFYRILLQRNADVQATSCEQFRTPLHFSAQNGHERDTQLLLEHGADVTLRDWEGNTPMLAVAKNGSTKIMRHLLAYGASLSVRARHLQDHRSSL